MHAGEIPSLDEVPALAVAAAVAQGTTVFTDVGELRVKEVDRLAAVAAMVEAFGARPGVDGDTLAVTGVGGPLRGARFDSLGDHRMAMAAAVAGAGRAAGRAQPLTGFGAVETSYPRFADDLARAGGRTGPPARRGRCWWRSTARPAPASPPSRPRWPSTSGVERLDTGAMYRAVAALALDRGIAPDDAAAVAALAERRDASRSASG